MRFSGKTFGWLGMAFVAAGSVLFAAQKPVTPVPPPSAQSLPAPSAQYRAVLDRYCVTCHNDRLKTASLGRKPLWLGASPRLV